MKHGTKGIESATLIRVISFDRVDLCLMLGLMFATVAVCSCYEDALLFFDGCDLSETACDALKSADSLFHNPLDHTRIVVTETEVVIQGRKAVGLASLLHFVQLRHIELMIFDDTPIVLGGIKREAGRQRAVGSDDHRVLTGAAVPRLDFASQKVLHVVEPLDGIHHFVALLILFD
jgi:hypothetical protein